MNSKPLFLGLFSLLLLGTASAQVQAQGRPAASATARSRMPLPVGEIPKDGLTLKQGRVMLTEQGVTAPLVGDKKLRNGTVVSTTGLVTAADGGTVQLTEGDMASLTGRVTTRREMVESDSLAKIKLFDALHPGKRQKMEDAAERKTKIKMKLAEDRAKMKAKAEKRKK